MAGGVVAELQSTESSSPAARQQGSEVIAGSTAIGPAAEIAALIAVIEASVVRIDVTTESVDRLGRRSTVEGTGTGFVFAADGSIATAAHVVSDATSITVTLADGSRVEGVAELAPDGDLAIVHVDRAGLVPLVLGRSETTLLGEMVIAVGHALALEGEPTVSLGIISALERDLTTDDGTTYSDLLQTDAAINAGDSGGPLVNMLGQVIGINTAKVSTELADNMGFAIAIDNAVPILTELAAGD